MQNNGRQRTCKNHSSPSISDYQWWLHHGNTVLIVELTRSLNGRQAILSSNAEEILKGRTVRLQQIGCGVTRKQVRSFAFQICEEKKIYRKKEFDDIYLIGAFLV
jgi:hypothetical protein